MQLLDAVSVEKGSNLARWRDELVVIKNCSPGTTSIGITPTMDPKVDALLAGLEDKRGDVQVIRVPAAEYRRVMYDGIDRRAGR